VADFGDPAWVKVIAIDEQSRVQQVHDGAFPTVDEVPQTAFTLTMPALLTARHLIAIVPGPTKSAVIRRVLTEPISTDCPASILRQIPRATLYLDTQAFSLAGPETLRAVR
jgi:glucosamine-6-phosphate deaminase